MLTKDLFYTKDDRKAIEKLKAFLPDKIFDAHSHLLSTEFVPAERGADEEILLLDLERYHQEMSEILGNPKEFRLNFFAYPDPDMQNIHSSLFLRTDAFIIEQLNKDNRNVAEIYVHPRESVEDIEKRLIHPNIKGFKCYHQLAQREDTFSADICEYLPESAWEIANKRKMCITLHMVKEEALADEGNMRYICEMAKKYPDAVLILAHAARSFAAWTGIESIERVAHLENVWFDFSAVCEPTAMLQIVKKAGLARCMWGSDYPVCRIRGKVISLADSFYWIKNRDLQNFVGKVPVRSWTIGLENLMAMRQLSELADFKEADVEDLFYHNAANLFDSII